LHIESVLEKFLGQKLTPKLPEFFDSVDNFANNTKVKIGVVAKYTKLMDAYLSIFESLKIAGVNNKAKIEIVLIDAEKLEEGNQEELNRLYEVKGVIVPGGFGSRGMEGKIQAVKWCRENQIPYLGICLGLQMAVLEFARNVCGLDAVSSELFETRDELVGKSVVIDLMSEQFQVEHKGGTMRLGLYQCNVEQGTIAFDQFKSLVIQERHRHRLEVQNEFVPAMESKGLVISGKHFRDEQKSDYLVEIIELPKTVHPYFVAIQSHPEFLGRPGTPHPLFDGLVKASLKI
jgi:CTP synthase